MTTPPPRPAADLMREIAELEAKATAAPWRLCEPRECPWELDQCGTLGESTVTVLGAGGYGVLCVPVSISTQHLDNERMWVALRNAARYLLAAEEEMRAWRESRPLSVISLIDAPIIRAKSKTDAAAREIGVTVE